MATLASSNVKPAPPESSGDETIARSSQLKTANHCDCTLYYQARSDKPFAALTVTTNRCSEVLARLKGHREIVGVQVATIPTASEYLEVCVAATVFDERNAAAARVWRNINKTTTGCVAKNTMWNTKVTAND
jgi:hypothetical protein